MCYGVLFSVSKLGSFFLIYLEFQEKSGTEVRRKLRHIAQESRELTPFTLFSSPCIINPPRAPSFESQGLGSPWRVQ